MKNKKIEAKKSYKFESHLYSSISKPQTFITKKKQTCENTVTEEMNQLNKMTKIETPPNFMYRALSVGKHTVVPFHKQSRKKAQGNYFLEYLSKIRNARKG